MISGLMSCFRYIPKYSEMKVRPLSFPYQLNLLCKFGCLMKSKETKIRKK